MRHGKGDMLPVAVGQDVLLFGDPLLGGLEATAAAGFGLAGLAEEAGVGAVRRGTTVAANAHGTGAAGEHVLDGEFGPVAEGIAVFIQVLAPAIVMLEQQLCRSGNIHGAESTGWQGTGKGRRRQPAHFAGVLILCVSQRGGGAEGLGALRRRWRRGDTGAERRLRQQRYRARTAGVLRSETYIKVNGRWAYLYRAVTARRP